MINFIHTHTHSSCYFTYTPCYAKYNGVAMVTYTIPSISDLNHWKNQNRNQIIRALQPFLRFSALHLSGITVIQENIQVVFFLSRRLLLIRIHSDQKHSARKLNVVPQNWLDLWLIQCTVCMLSGKKKVHRITLNLIIPQWTKVHSQPEEWLNTVKTWVNGTLVVQKDD